MSTFFAALAVIFILIFLIGNDIIKIKPMFINADEFFFLATNYRVVNIRGRYGSGKTLLSVALSYEFWRRNYIDHIFSNFPMMGQSFDWSVSTKFIMILDEAHVILDSRQFSKNASSDWLKDLRKRLAILILPAVIDVDKRFRAVMVQRMFFLGNFIWLYAYKVDDGMSELSGWFGLIRPSAYFGKYSTKYVVQQDDFDNMRAVMANDLPAELGSESYAEYMITPEDIERAEIEETEKSAPEKSPDIVFVSNGNDEIKMPNFMDRGKFKMFGGSKK